MRPNLSPSEYSTGSKSPTVLSSLSSRRVDSPSLRYYARKHAAATPLRVRLSMRNLSMDGDLLNIPLYLADRAVSFMERALAEGRVTARRALTSL